MHTRVTITFLLALLLFPLLDGRAAESQLPTWPKNFQLTLGEQASFGIPVTQAGNITVKVSWQGQPMDIALVNMAGRMVAQQSAKAAPTATLTYNATGADLTGGPVWMIKLAAPKGTPGRNAQTGAPIYVVQGTISAKYPEVQQAAVQQSFTGFQTSKRTMVAKLTQPKTTTTTATVGMAVPVEKNRSQRLMTQQRTLSSRMVSSVTANITGKPPRLPITTPTIISVSPAAAIANDHIFITVVCVGSNQNNEVGFVAGNSTSISKPVSQVLQADNSLVIEAVVPALVGPTTISAVRVNAYDRNPMVSTPPFPFKVTRSASPEITSYLPNPPVSEKEIAVTCTHLTPGAKLHFKMPDGLEYVQDKQSIVGQQIKTTVPKFTLTDSSKLTMWVVNSDYVLGQTVTVNLPANVPVLTATDRASAEPGETVLLTGKNLKVFQSVRVALEDVKPVNAATTKIYTPTSGCSKTSEGWYVSNFTDNQILAVVPPNMGGFTGPVKGKLTVRGAGTLVASVPFTVNPLPVILPICPAKVATAKFVMRDDLDDWYEMNKKSNGGILVWVGGIHCGGWGESHSGNDIYEVDPSSADYFFCRDNGWTIDNGEVLSFPDVLSTFPGTTAGAYTWTTGVTPDMKRYFINVRWWADMHTFLSYYATIYLRGFQGVPITQPK
jgi:hypothetical protein